MKKTWLSTLNLLFYVGILSGCSTAMEMTSSNDSALGYTPIKTSEGATKYVRQRNLSQERRRQLLYDSFLQTSRPPLQPIKAEVEKPSAPDTAKLKAEDQNANNETNNGADKISMKSPPPSIHSPLNLSTFLAASSQSKVTHMGVAIDIDKNDSLQFSLGVSFFDSDKFYLGFDGIARLQLFNTFISPYIGAGVYLGDSKKCQYSYDYFGDQIETCEKYFLSTLYPEVGMKFRVNQNDILIFYRGYSQIDQSYRDKASEIYGVGVTF
ncbi:MAG: hypothetical protein KDD50_12680 [Bdellovibrionales bacterium]|nr:hypothetical protein [Bdellovibrionales bacterium]